MTHRAPPGRVIRTDALARVEGEGGMYVALRDGEVAEVQLRIYEPPRFFEAFLQGRAHTEPPDITARICGICPVAYQMSACRAIEDACGIDVPEPIEALRRLIYCGEWIESHALHIYLLHAPDFLGYDGGIELARDHRDTVQRGLDLKKAGNTLIEVIGGRAVHPVNVKVGGWYRAPTRRDLRPLIDVMERARDQALETVQWVAGFDFPDYEWPYEFVALRQPGEYPITRGRIVSSSGLDVAADEFESVIEEYQVPHSTALHARARDGSNYLVGPLARYNLNHDELSPLARDAAREAGLDAECLNPFRSIVVRAVETLYACDEAVRLLSEYEPPDSPAVAVEPRAATGFGVTEAPRGLLYHRYQIDDDGTILAATITPPTSQNQPIIEHDLWHVVSANVATDSDRLRLLCEQTIRNYDPCISCATHFLDLVVEDVT